MKNTINSKLTGASGQGSNIVEEEDSCHEIFEKYPFLGAYRIFPSYVWWNKLFHQGVIDLNELNESISSSKYFQDENRPSWIKLWHFSELSDDVFEKLIQEVESDFRSRIYSDSGVITHVVGLFLMFSNAGIYKRTSEDILEDAMSYVNELNHSNQLEPLYPYVSLPATIMFGSYQSLSFQGQETEEFKRFISHLKETREKAYIKEMPRKAQELIKIMCDDIFRFHKIVCFDTPFDSDVDCDENRRYHEVPILSFIEPSIFFDKTIAMKGEDAQYIFWVLSERYKYDNNNRTLFDELDWLRSVQEILLNKASHRKGKLSGYRLTLLNENYLVEAIERLSSAKASLQGQIVSQPDEIQIEI